MTTLRPLAATDFPEIHRAFLEAFGDYAVPLTLSPDELREMITRRGWLPEASVGAFDGERMVAFTLNGLGTWNGSVTGYDTGTGVVPSHRSQGLTRQMMDASYDLLRSHGAVQYLLEVLQANERAFGIYSAAGFRVTRELQCWSFDGREPGVPRAEPAGVVDWETVCGFFDVAPSWQNSIDSVLRARAPRTILVAREDDALAGCTVVFGNGDVPFLAVAPDRRRRGTGRELLLAAAATAGRPLRIVNVETGYAAADAFLRSCGATETVRQFEMLRDL